MSSNKQKNKPLQGKVIWVEANVSQMSINQLKALGASVVVVLKVTK